MKLHINGSERNFAAGSTLGELLGHYRIPDRAIVVEHNGQVVVREKVQKTPLREGDRIEIVHLVGGGSSSDGEIVPAPEDKGEGTGDGNGQPKAPKRRQKKATTAKGKTRAARRGAGAAVPGKGPRNLVIVESPAKAKTINKFLGPDYLVEASMGHVRDLPRSKMGVDPEKDFEPHYIVIRKASKTVKHLKHAAKGKSTIFLAPDPDREGEAISWHLAHIFREANGELPIHRVTFNEITKQAIEEAFQHPRVIAMNLVEAQQARRILDRLVGYELSPLLWRKVGRGLSAGRVQSVTLRLIVEREREVRKFVPQEYWSLLAHLSGLKPENAGKIFRARLDKIGEAKADLKNQEETERVRAALQNASFRVASVDRKERRRRPQAPFTTSKLQQEAYNRLRFPAAKTMRVAQHLYEGVELGDQETVGLITYMRTDSVNVAVSARTEVVQYIRDRFGEPFLPKDPPVYRSKKGAQEAHEAVRPTSVKRAPADIRHFLSDDEFKLYELIWGKFVASQMNPAVDEWVSVSILGGEEYTFKVTGQKNLFPGFTVVYGGTKPSLTAEGAAGPEGEEEDELDTELPALTAGEILKLHELVGRQHFTKPPSRFNDASLVKTLEEDGIGRPSTYAPTIYTLVAREYVNRKGGALIPTELGETVVDLLVEYFPNVMNVQFTAAMEEELDKVAEGQMNWVQVLKDFYGPFQTYLVKAREEMKNIRHEVVPTEHQCDVCGKVMLLRMGRFGRFLACAGFPDCRYTRSMPTGFRCPEPECGGDLVQRRSKNRRTFYGCSKYPKCTHIANRLPNKPGEDGEGEEEQLPDTEKGALGI